MQQTLLEELSAARQVLLHGQIAEALLATYGSENRDHLPALAEHLRRVGGAEPGARAAGGLDAAPGRRSAADALAWDDAATASTSDASRSSPPPPTGSARTRARSGANSRSREFANSE